MDVYTLKEGTRPQGCGLFILNLAEHEILIAQLVLSNLHELFFLLPFYFHFQCDDEANTSSQTQYCFL